MKNGWVRWVGLGSIVFSAIIALARCGGGGDGGGGTPSYSISGQVTLSGAGLSGVTMTLSGKSAAITTTDAGGNYAFAGLDNGNYTVTPSRAGFTFNPPSSPETVNGANITAVNFTATAVTYSISGQVTLSSVGLSGVTMALSGTHVDNTTTDAGGNYAFTTLVNGNYTVTPSKTGYSFTPASSPETVNGANITAVDFTATALVAQIVACPAAGTDNVSIVDFAFSPASVTIDPNDIVKWTNNGSTHTVTSGTSPTQDGKFNSGNLANGATVCVQFYQSGAYPYFCTIHPFMIGSVTVR